jgi:hypothetical protein
MRLEHPNAVQRMPESVKISDGFLASPIYLPKKAIFN